MQDIYIAGYPRSGNVWLSRLVSDIFNCSITGSQGRTSIAETQRPNKNYHVYQDHFYPVLLDNGDAEFVKKRNLIISNKPDNAYIVFVYRNPLDVAVSVYKYWRMDSLRTALKEMKDGGRVPCYPKFMTAWLDSSSKRFVNTSRLRAVSVGNSGRRASDNIAAISLPPLSQLSFTSVSGLSSSNSL